MLQEILEKIGVVLVFLFTSEYARRAGEHAAEDRSTERSPLIDGNGEDFNNDSPDRDSSHNLPESSSHNLLVNTDPAAYATTIETDLLADTTSIATLNNINEDATWLKSCKTSFFISSTIALAIIPPSLLMISVLYLDVNTSSICSKLKMNNNTLPQEVIKYVIIGEDVEAVALNFWFQFMLILLFGWGEFKSYHLGTLLLGFLLGLTVVLIKTALFFKDIDFTKTYYKLPGNAIFLFGVVYSSYRVAKKVCHDNSTSDETRSRMNLRHVFAIVSTQFFLGFLIAIGYTYLFVPWFRNTEDSIDQAIIALVTPTLFLIPVIISENLALKSLSFAKAGRIFVLVYFVNGVSILLYCIMQAGVRDVNIFIVLSVFRGLLQVFQTATVKLRHRIFARIWKCLRLGDLREETSQHRRLRVDKEIQTMLYQSIAIILSQAYLVSYITCNYDVKTWEIIEEFIIKRVSIGIGISFLANCSSILIHIHWHNTLLAEVWKNHWKLHLFATTLVGVMSVCYFTYVLLSVFENFANSKEYHIRDCTVPFQ